MIATILDLEALYKVIVASLVAGVGISAVFGVMVYGGTRFVDMRRESRPMAAGAYGVLATLALIGFIAGLVYGLHVMTSK